VGAQFRLRPDEVRTNLIVFWLGVALRHHPDVALHAVVVMSNHLHACLTDGSGELSSFMGHWLGNVARAVNRLDGTSGPVFEQRYSAGEILDDEAMLERIIYAVTNPVAAGLVTRAADWGGLCLWQGGRVRAEGTRLRHREWMTARARAETEVEREAFVDHATVEITPLDGANTTAELIAGVEARTAELQRDRGAARSLGMRKVLRQKVFDAPETPKRSPRPLCHASTAELWLAFRDGWRRFVQTYRVASEAFCAGNLNAPFPEHTFRPPLRV